MCSRAFGLPASDVFGRALDSVLGAAVLFVAIGLERGGRRVLVLFGD